MISLIICSKQASFLQGLVSNVTNTIGVPFEIMPIDNNSNTYDICEAYNLGAAKSSFDILCFVHEDVRFHTCNWGEILIHILKDKEIGIVGVIGGIYKSKIPSGWWDIPYEYKRMNLLQGLAEGRVRKDIINPNEANMSNVVTLDGVFMCMRKEVWNEFPFNEKEIKGFHFYDLDLSLRVGQKYTLVVTHQLLLEHYSEGNINAQWVNYAFKFHEKWAKYLPTYIEELDLSKEQIQLLEYKACKALINYCVANNCSYSIIIPLLIQCFKFDFNNRDNFWLIKKYIRSKLI